MFSSGRSAEHLPIVLPNKRSVLAPLGPAQMRVLNGTDGTGVGFANWKMHSAVGRWRHGEVAEEGWRGFESNETGAVARVVARPSPHGFSPLGRTIARARGSAH